MNVWEFSTFVVCVFAILTNTWMALTALRLQVGNKPAVTIESVEGDVTVDEMSFRENVEAPASVRFSDMNDVSIGGDVAGNNVSKSAR